MIGHFSDTSYETPQVDVSISIKSAASMTKPGLNSEPQPATSSAESNFEEWNPSALSFRSIKIDRIPPFDIQNSLFDIRFTRVDGFRPFPRCDLNCRLL